MSIQSSRKSGSVGLFILSVLFIATAIYSSKESTNTRIAGEGVSIPGTLCILTGQDEIFSTAALEKLKREGFRPTDHITRQLVNKNEQFNDISHRVPIRISREATFPDPSCQESGWHNSFIP